MTISLRTIALVLVALAAGAAGMLLFGGSSGEPATTAPDPPTRQVSSVAVPPPPAPDAPIATVEGEDPGSSLSLLDLRRTGAKVVTARLRIEYDAARSDISGGIRRCAAQVASRPRTCASSTRNGREHLVLRNRDDECLCSGVFQNVDDGEVSVIFAKFPAPPEGVDRVSLETPGFASFDAVPLT